MPRVNCRSVCSPTCIQSCCNCLCSFIPSPPLPWQKGRHRSLNEVEDRLTQVYRTQGTNLMALFHENGSSKQLTAWCLCVCALVHVLWCGVCPPHRWEDPHPLSALPTSGLQCRSAVPREWQWGAEQRAGSG